MVVATRSSISPGALLAEFAKWAAPRLAIYGATILVVTAAFFVGAFVYAAFWHGPERLQNEPMRVPGPAAFPIPNKPKPAPPRLHEIVANLDSGIIATTNFVGLSVLDANKEKVGSVRKLMFNKEGVPESILIEVYPVNGTKTLIGVPVMSVKWLVPAQPTEKSTPTAAVLNVTAAQLQKEHPAKAN